MMSLPKASWTSTVEAGVNLCVSPFRCDWKVTPSSVILRRSGEAEDLEAAGIGEDGAGPGHESVQAAELADQFVAGAEEQVVGVAEDDAGVEVFPEVALGEAFDGGLGADGHEDGRRDVAVFGVQNAGAGAGFRAFGEEFEGDLAQSSIVIWGFGCTGSPRTTIKPENKI